MFRVFVALWVTAIAPAASGATISFVHEGVGSGTMGVMSFADASFTITAVGDTADRQSASGFIFWIEHTSATIEIDGIGVFAFVSGTRTFVNNDLAIPSRPSIGFSRSVSEGSYDLLNDVSIPDTWDMLSSIEPVSGKGDLLQWDTGNQVLTTGGRLIFDWQHNAAMGFSATVVPVPAAFWLLFSTIASLSLFRRTPPVSVPIT